jgi:hypothetical protein
MTAEPSAQDESKQNSGAKSFGSVAVNGEVWSLKSREILRERQNKCTIRPQTGAG